jgi:hypothetical protein
LYSFGSEEGENETTSEKESEGCPPSGIPNQKKMVKMREPFLCEDWEAGKEEKKKRLRGCDG